MAFFTGQIFHELFEEFWDTEIFIFIIYFYSYSISYLAFCHSNSENSPVKYKGVSACFLQPSEKRPWECSTSHHWGLSLQVQPDNNSAQPEWLSNIFQM